MKHRDASLLGRRVATEINTGLWDPDGICSDLYGKVITQPIWRVVASHKMHSSVVDTLLPLTRLSAEFRRAFASGEIPD